MNQKKNVLLFNVFFLLLLIIATFLFEWKPDLLGANFRPINILADVQVDSLQTSDSTSIATAENIAKSDSVVHVGNKVIIIRDYTSYAGLVNSAGQDYPLQSFLQSLDGLKKRTRKKVRVAYFGDSFIEGDLITQDLRKQLQDTFGGMGVGFVPMTSIVAGFRQTITHGFSKDWNDVSFKSDDKADANLFISGHSFFSDANSWVNYHTVDRPHLNFFNNVAILYGIPTADKSANATITVNDKQQAITAAQQFNEADFIFDSIKNVRVSVSSKDIPMYGAAFESDEGIYVDNFSFRGITGVEFNYFDTAFLQQIQKTRPYDLLIFQYGPNLLFRPNLSDFSWYTKKMQPILKKITTAFPHTSILLVSTADKDFNYDGGTWTTEKGVQPLVDGQYQMARSANIDFFNLFHAMGGANSLVNWVEGDTTYANKDYTHVNSRGGKRIAGYLYNAIMKEYNDFEKHPD
jgi:lysophospholipase L1-like esterase